MFGDFNIIAVLAAALANVIIGFLWYQPRAFGTVWMRHASLSPEAVAASRKRMPFFAMLGFCASFVTAWVLAHFAFVWGTFTVGTALELAFWIWLGFIAPILLAPVLWEGKHMHMFAINAGYWLVSVSVMAVIITLWT